jgi:hypothetical protein
MRRTGNRLKWKLMVTVKGFRDEWLPEQEEKLWGPDGQKGQVVALILNRLRAKGAAAWLVFCVVKRRSRRIHGGVRVFRRADNALGRGAASLLG